MTHSFTRRLVSTLAGGALAVGGIGAVGLATATPAAASNRTICSQVIKTLEHTNGHVIGEAFRICNDGEIINLSVILQQRDPATGQWKTVATGSGFAGYQCQGTTVKRYRVGTIGTGTAFPCG
jgi:hypothetical protein